MCPEAASTCPYGLSTHGFETAIKSRGVEHESASASRGCAMARLGRLIPSSAVVFVRGGGGGGGGEGDGGS
jgi:hypothetical protein